MELYQLTIRRLLDFFGPSKKVDSIRKRDADLFIGAQLHHIDNDHRELPIKTLQYLLGHSNSATTLKFYQQVDPASAAQAVSAAAAQIDPKPEADRRAIDAQDLFDVESEAGSERL